MARIHHSILLRVQGVEHDRVKLHNRLCRDVVLPFSDSHPNEEKVNNPFIDKETPTSLKQHEQWIKGVI